MLTDLFFWIIPLIIGIIIFIKTFKDMDEKFWLKVVISFAFSFLTSLIVFVVSALLIYGLILTSFILAALPGQAVYRFLDCKGKCMDKCIWIIISPFNLRANDQIR